MNKVYKVIWSSAKGCYIVVSELAHKGRNKAKSLKAVCALTALLFAGSLGLGQLEAQAAEGDVVYVGKDSRGNISIAVNKDSKTEISYTGTAENNIVIGEDGEIKTTSNSKIWGDCVKIEKSDNLLSIGDGNEVKDSLNNTIYGNNNSVNKSNNSVVFGNGNKIYSPSVKEYNTVVGTNIQFGTDPSRNVTEKVVAIGSNITAPMGATGAILIGDGVGVASYGKNSITIGTSAKGSPDAVVIGAEASGEATSIAIGSKAKATSTNGVAIGQLAKAYGTEAVAIGSWSSINSGNAVGIGRSTKIGTASVSSIAIGQYTNIGDNTDHAIAIGGSSSTSSAASIGDNSSASISVGWWSDVGNNAEYSIALGYVSQVGEGAQNSTALGAFSKIGAGAKQSNAIGYLAEIGENVQWGNAFGSWASVNSSYGTAVGTSSSVAAGSGRSVAVGSSSEVLADDLFTADELAAWKQAHTEYAKFDIQKADSEYGVFSIGSADKERRIINVANGRIAADSTDAINGSQLFGAMEYLNGRIDNIEQSGGSGGNTTVHPDDDNVVVQPTPENPQPDKDVDYGLSLNKDKIDLGNVTIEGNKGDITAEEYKVGDKTYISESGLNANDQKITNVADGEISADSKDAVNGSQLYATNQKIDNITQDIDNVNNRVDKLDGKINKVGAGAAALAALHPLDFDPDDKLTFSAGVGHYEGETAAALGAFYRPDEKVMFSLGGTVGNGDEMINAGISFALDRTSNVNNSKVAMAKEIVDLKEQVAQLTALVNQMAALNGMTSKQVDMFPDVPENHWAYVYLDKLVQAGIIEGYPDGNFKGDRTMTRYEFATMLCRALEKGIVLDQRVAGEFAVELNRIRVDRISGEDNEADKVERVRVVKAEERDNYGSKIK